MIGSAEASIDMSRGLHLLPILALLLLANVLGCCRTDSVQDERGLQPHEFSRVPWHEIMASRDLGSVASLPDSQASEHDRTRVLDHARLVGFVEPAVWLEKRQRERSVMMVRDGRSDGSVIVYRVDPTTVVWDYFPAY